MTVQAQEKKTNGNMNHEKMIQNKKLNVIKHVKSLNKLNK